MIPTHLRKVFELIRFKREPVLRTPFALNTTMKNQVLGLLDESMSVTILVLPTSFVEQQRFTERVPEADVSQPSIFQLNQQSHVIEWRIESATLASHTC